VPQRFRNLDRPLVVIVTTLIVYGLLMLYSAGRTDVPTIVATIWGRQMAWLTLGIVCAVLVFRVSPRLLEWATPYVYGVAIFVLLLTLLFGTGAGTAASSKSWIAIAGQRLGQPAELAKLAVILMLARWLADRREPPATLRDLLYPGLITFVPFALVVLQPDLGSAIVFVAILFSMLYWAGTRPALLLLLASPAIGLVLAFSTVVWGAWIVLLFVFVLWLRPYVWEGLTVMLANVLMGSSRCRSGGTWRLTSRAGCWHSSIRRRTRGQPDGTLSSRRSRSARAGGSARASRSVPRNGWPSSRRSTLISFSRWSAKSSASPGCRGIGAAHRPAARAVANRAPSHRSVLELLRLRHRRDVLRAHRGERRDGGESDAGDRHPAAVFSYGGSFLLTCFLAIGIALRVAWESRQSGYADLSQ
jgi:cell division protein FtsW (lipid II flippase)